MTATRVPSRNVTSMGHAQTLSIATKREIEPGWATGAGAAGNGQTPASHAPKTNQRQYFRTEAQRGAVMGEKLELSADAERKHGTGELQHVASGIAGSIFAPRAAPQRHAV